MEKPGRAKAFNCPNCGAALASESPSCGYCGSAVATRVCPACFGPVSAGMRHCPACGARTADAAAGKKRGLTCPRCREALNPVEVGTHLLDTCARCGGLWLDRNTFQSICTRAEEQEAVLGDSGTAAALQPDHRRPYIPCPECGELMNRKNFAGCSGIILDWCRTHGSWFDRKELQQVVSFIRRGGLRKARERELQRLKDDGNRLRMDELSLAALERRLGSRSLLEPNSNDALLEYLAKLV